MEKPKQDVIQNPGGSTPLQTEQSGSGRKWTPGPWRAVRAKMHSSRICPSDFTTLALVYGLRMPPSPNNGEANALLIAAAPELYEALEEIRDCFKYFVSHPEESDGPMMIRISLTAVEMMHKKVLAVLAKARGESGEPDQDSVRSGVEPQDVK